MNGHPVRRAGLGLRRAISASMVEPCAAGRVGALIGADPAPAGVACDLFFLDGAALAPAVGRPE